jgi:hypothetical protein
MTNQHIYTPVDDQLNNLSYIVQEKDCDVLVTKWMTRQRVEKLELNMQRSHRWALVLIPLGGDGGIGHAVTIVGDLIFDSTQTHALRFKRNLWIGVAPTIMVLTESLWQFNFHGKNISHLKYNLY